MAKKNVSKEKLKEQILQSQLEDLLKHCPEPTYRFNVGDVVNCGALKDPVVEAVIADGKVYTLKYMTKLELHGNQLEEVRRNFAWYQIRPAAEWSKDSFIRNKDFRLCFSNRTIDDIISKAYRFGLDLDPDYQRGYVWTAQQKEDLIDSIFKNIDIGKFVYVQNDYGSENLYEVLDGKQRISTILEFFENKFPYKGKYFNDLCGCDRNHFEDYCIQVAEIRRGKKETILKYFLLLNTTGTPMSKEHLDNIVRRLYDERV